MTKPFNSLVHLSTALFLGLVLVAFQASASDSPGKSQPLQKVGSGELTSLQDYMEPGKWTVVMIWSDSCHVCNQEAPKYSAFHSRHAAKDAKIIGVSLDGSQKTARSFVDRHDLNYPNLVGDVRDVATLYQSESGEAFRATPTFMVFDPEGTLQAAQAGGVPPDVVEKFISGS